MEDKQTDILTIDEVPGQKELAEWQKEELREAGINLNELTAEDIKIIKLNSDHLDRLKKIHGATVGDEEDAIENALQNNQGDSGNDDSDNDQTQKTDSQIVFDGNVTEFPIKADKTPNVDVSNNTENESSSSAFRTKKQERKDENVLERYNQDNRTWVEMVTREADTRGSHFKSAAQA